MGRHFATPTASTGNRCLRKAIALRPDDPDARIHLSGVLLLTGKFSDGWGEYEWRLLKPSVGHPQSKFPKPRWTGQELSGKRILLHSEQGAGDLIQFSRLSPLSHSAERTQSSAVLPSYPDSFAPCRAFPN